MEDSSDRRSVSSRAGVGRSNSFSTFYMPSKVGHSVSVESQTVDQRMGEYVPIHYRRVSCDKYDLAYDRYYTEYQTNTAAELLARWDRQETETVDPII